MSTRTASASSYEVVFAHVAEWEYECCGDPVRLGGTGKFTLTSYPPGKEPVTFSVQRHEVEGPRRHVRARVCGLWEQRRNSDSAAYEPLREMRIDEDGRPALGRGARGWVLALQILHDIEVDDDAGPFDGRS